MKTKLTLIALALAACAVPNISMAGGPQVIHIDELAQMSGLRLRETRMLFAAARSSYPEYHYTFDRVERRFIAAMGRERYELLQAGLPVEIERTIDGRRVTMLVRLDPAS
ncbi:MAG TPA: hypothetical protein VM619_04310 [Luteimonas sp.]|nr:hypothetical protein [Luteimonas sp.]